MFDLRRKYLICTGNMEKKCIRIILVTKCKKIKTKMIQIVSQVCLITHVTEQSRDGSYYKHFKHGSPLLLSALFYARSS